MRKNKTSESAGVRILYTEIHGSDETVQNAISQFAAAVRPSLEQEKRVVQVISTAPLDDEQSLLAHAESLAEHADDVLEAEFAPSSEAARPNEQSDRPSRTKRKPRSYSFVKNLNLRPDGNSALADFVADKSPKDQQERFVVVLYYLKNVLQLESVGPNHLYTAWKELGDAKVPPDLVQTARNIANRKNWVDSSDSNDLKMTVTGENFVEQDLPATSGKG